MAISLIYTPPFLAVERAKETQQWQNCPSTSRVACNKALSGSVPLDKRDNEGAECVRSET